MQVTVSGQPVIDVSNTQPLGIHTSQLQLLSTTRQTVHDVDNEPMGWIHLLQLQCLTVSGHAVGDVSSAQAHRIHFKRYHRTLLTCISSSVCWLESSDVESWVQVPVCRAA